MSVVRWLFSALAVVAAALAAYWSATQASRRKRLAAEERALEMAVGDDFVAAATAADRAREHERAAQRASDSAALRISQIATRDDTLAEVVAAWKSGPA